MQIKIKLAHRCDDLCPHNVQCSRRMSKSENRIHITRIKYNIKQSINYMEIIYGNQMFVMALWMIRCHSSQFIRAKCRLTIATANETWKCEIVRSLKKIANFHLSLNNFFLGRNSRKWKRWYELIICLVCIFRCHRQVNRWNLIS